MTEVGTVESHGEVSHRQIARWAAEVNVRAQENLFNMICVHQTDSGNDLATVASRLGISEDEARDVLSGKTDLTLSELRQVAIACDVVVDYDVRPARAAQNVWITTLAASRILKADPGSVWEHRPVSSAARHYLVERV